MDQGFKQPRTSRTHSKKLEYKVTESKIKKTRKWSEEEIQILLGCIQKYGHNAFRELQERLPHKTLDSIKNYLGTAKHKSKELPTHHILDKWLNACENINVKSNTKKYDDSIQVAQVIKYLSVDGLLENHPLPENCNGIDFPAAYRLLHQALMGYPLQPVNKETANFITETIGTVILEVTNQVECNNAFENVITHLKGYFNNSGDNKKEDNVIKAPSEKVLDKTPACLYTKKPIRTYQKKKLTQPIDETPVLKVNILPTLEETTTQISSLQSFAVSVEGTNECSLVDVPVPESSANDERSKQLARLYKSPSYNPFRLPEELIKL